MHKPGEQQKMSLAMVRLAYDGAIPARYRKKGCPLSRGFAFDPADKR